MTVKQTLDRARKMLEASTIEDSRLESEMLLMAALKIDRVQLYQGFDRKLRRPENKKFWGLVERRLKHEPTAYITGRREFYGLDFQVDRNVLIPRPESELLVEKALELAQNHDVASIAEVGTGCGALAVSLALNLPQARIYASDISAAALRVASINCQQHGVANRIRLLSGDLLDPLPEPVDLIIANLPYVREADLPRLKTRNLEPALALNGGADGLDKIRKLGNQLSNKLRPGGCLLLEIGQGQGEAVTTFLRSLFPSAKIAVAPDLSGIDRVVSLALTTITPASEV